jgi:hypothetical protein
MHLHAEDAQHERQQAKTSKSIEDEIMSGRMTYHNEIKTQ